MNPNEILKILEKHQALILDSHIVYTSGKHGRAYVNKDAIYPHTSLTSELCAQMAETWRNEKIDAVVAPALGGIILSQWVAYHLSQKTGKEVFGVYAEKDGDSFLIKRGYDNLIRNKRVLLLEDVLTTGGSIKKVVSVVREIPAEVVGVSALCNRGGIKENEIGNVPKLKSLFAVNFEAWDAPDCPLCRQGVAINTQVGKGKEFLEKNR